MLLSMLAPPGAPSPEELIKFYAENKVMNYAMVQNGVIVNVVDWDGVTPCLRQSLKLLPCHQKAPR